MQVHGDLRPVLAAAAKALRPGGRLIFTVKKAGDGERGNRGFFLQHHGRYCHSEEYVRGTLSDAGLFVREVTFAVLRLEAAQPVQAIVVSSRRASV